MKGWEHELTWLWGSFHRPEVYHIHNLYILNTHNFVSSILTMLKMLLYTRTHTCSVLDRTKMRLLQNVYRKVHKDTTGSVPHGDNNTMQLFSASKDWFLILWSKWKKTNQGKNSIGKVLMISVLQRPDIAPSQFKSPIKLFCSFLSKQHKGGLEKWPRG